MAYLLGFSYFARRARHIQELQLNGVLQETHNASDPGMILDNEKYVSLFFREENPHPDGGELPPNIKRNLLNYKERLQPYINVDTKEYDWVKGIRAQIIWNAWEKKLKDCGKYTCSKDQIMNYRADFLNNPSSFFLKHFQEKERAEINRKIIEKVEKIQSGKMFNHILEYVLLDIFRQQSSESTSVIKQIYKASPHTDHCNGVDFILQSNTGKWIAMDITMFREKQNMTRDWETLHPKNVRDLNGNPINPRVVRRTISLHKDRYLWREVVKTWVDLILIGEEPTIQNIEIAIKEKIKTRLQNEEDVRKILLQGRYRLGMEKQGHLPSTEKVLEAFDLQKIVSSLTKEILRTPEKTELDAIAQRERRASAAHTPS